MKALLMHRDRDFDPHESLRDVMYGYRDARRNLELQLSRHDRALIQDLELNVLLQAMAGGDEFLFEVVRKAILSGCRNDLETILYRQEALKDCLKNATVVRQLYEVTVEATEETRKRWWSVSNYQHPSSILYSAIDMLEVLSQKLRKLRRIGEAQAALFESEAFRAMFAMLQKELSDEYLARIEGHLSDVKFRRGVLLSAELDDRNQGTNYMLRHSSKQEPNWFQRMLGKGPPAYTFYIADRDQAGAEILADMRHRGISRVAVALAQSGEHVLDFFKMLRTELGFYIGCLNLRDRLAAQGSSFCFPVPFAADQRKHQFRGLYDVCLALQMNGKIVPNDVDADSKHLVVITGANQGGKSTFLRSIGIAQLMMQAGLFVGAEMFEAELTPALFTHYKREEDVSMKSGKFDEELARMSDIADSIVPNAIVLFNESFAATNEREGSEIARQIVCALLEKRVKVFYVTHLYTFARTFAETNDGQALFLRAERNPDGTRTFRLMEGQPLETSYGEDLYREIFEPEARGPSGESHGATSVVAV
jgi:DNA mismatch repair ATPase MutS